MVSAKHHNVEGGGVGISSALAEGAVAIPSQADPLSPEQVKKRAQDVTAEDIRNACKRLGIDPVYDAGLDYIVDEFLAVQLPRGWQRFKDPNGREYYYNKTTKVTQWQHPLEEYYRSVVFMQKEGSKMLLEAAARNPPSPLEARDMAIYLGIDLAKEPFLVDVAKAAVNAPLPPHWEEYEDNDGTSRFFNTESKQETTTHPLDGYFLELSKRVRLQKNMEGRRGSSVAKWYRFHECASLPDAGHAPYPWGEFVDLTQGRVYYFNYQTNEVSWHHPGPLVRQQIREAAAACIQAAFKGFRYRKARKLAGQLWKVEATEDAVKKAKEAKGKEARKRIKESEGQRKAAAATEIQRRWRGHVARRDLRSRRRRAAAVRLQCWWRGVLARRATAWLSANAVPVLSVPPPKYALGPMPLHRHPAAPARLAAVVRAALAPVEAFLADCGKPLDLPKPESGVAILPRSRMPPYRVTLGAADVSAKAAPEAVIVPLEGQEGQLAGARRQGSVVVSAREGAGEAAREGGAEGAGTEGAGVECTEGAGAEGAGGEAGEGAESPNRGPSEPERSSSAAEGARGFRGEVARKHAEARRQELAEARKAQEDQEAPLRAMSDQMSHLPSLRTFDLGASAGASAGASGAGSAAADGAPPPPPPPPDAPATDGLGEAADPAPGEDRAAGKPTPGAAEDGADGADKATEADQVDEGVAAVGENRSEGLEAAATSAAAERAETAECAEREGEASMPALESAGGEGEGEGGDERGSGVGEGGVALESGGGEDRPHEGGEGGEVAKDDEQADRQSPSSPERAAEGDGDSSPAPHPTALRGSGSEGAGRAEGGSVGSSHGPEAGPRWREGSEVRRDWRPEEGDGRPGWADSDDEGEAVARGRPMALEDVLGEGLPREEGGELGDVEAEAERLMEEHRRAGKK